MTDQGKQPASDRWYHKGPVLMRGRQVPKSTTDQRLLDSRGTADWVHTDPWRVLRIQAEFVEGFGALAELGLAVSVFGSARTPPDHPMYAAARQIGRRLVEAGTPLRLFARFLDQAGQRMQFFGVGVSHRRQALQGGGRGGRRRDQSSVLAFGGGQVRGEPPDPRVRLPGAVDTAAPPTWSSRSSTCTRRPARAR